MSAEYPIRYTSEVSQAVTGIDQLTAKLLELEAVVNRLTPKLKDFSKGVAPALNAATKAADKFGTSAGSLDAKVGAASAAVTGLGAAATAAAAGVAVAGTATTSLGTRLGTAAGKAGAMGVALDGVAASAAVATPALAATGVAAGEMTPTLNVATAGSNALGGSLGRFIGISAGIAAAHMAMRTFADAMNDAREFAREAAEEVLKLEDSVRELRMTMGKGTTTKEASEAVVQLMLASGAEEKAATDFNTMWESTIFAAQKKGNWGLNAKDTMEAKQQALAYAVASGMDAKTIGEVVPLIAVGEKIESKEQLLGKLGTMGRLAVEGVGNLTPMMKVYEKLRGTMVRPEGGGAFKSSEELMGAISATSVDAGNVPAVTTAIRQVWRDLSFADNDKKKATFKQLGIEAADDFETRVKKLAPLIHGAKARGLDEQAAMVEAGFTRTGSNPKAIQIVTEQAVLEENLKIARQAPKGKDVVAQVEQFRKEQPNRFAVAAVQAAKLGRGQETKDLEVLRKFAEAGMTLPSVKELNTPTANAAEGLTDIIRLGGLTGEKGREAMLDKEVRDRIRATVPDAGKRFPALAKHGLMDREAEGQELADIVNSLKPEERAALFKETETFGRTGKRGPERPDSRPFNPFTAAGAVPLPEVVPAGRPGAAGAGGPAGGAGGIGPQAAAFGLGGATDPLMMGVQKEQAKLLNRLVAIAERPRGLNGSGGPSLGPLPFDDGDFGGRRA